MQRNEVCMNTKTVFDRLQSIDDEVQKLHNTIFALKTTDIQGDNIYGKRNNEPEHPYFNP